MSRFDPTLCDECETRPHRVQRGAIRYCRECDPQAVRRPDPVAESERQRLAAEAEATIARATVASRAEAEENERREEAARRSRHATRISSAAPIVHPPVTPPVRRRVPVATPAAPPAPKPPPAPVERRKPVPPRPARSPVTALLAEYVRAHNGCTNPEAMAALGVPARSLKRAAKNLRSDGVLAFPDRRNALHYDRLFLAGQAPPRPPVEKSKQCAIDGCNLKRVGRGMCNAHWLEWRHGKRDAPPQEERTDTERKILEIVTEKPGISRKATAEALGIHESTAAYHIRQLRQKGLVAPAIRGFADGNKGIFLPNQNTKPEAQDSMTMTILRHLFEHGPTSATNLKIATQDRDVRRTVYALKKARHIAENGGVYNLTFTGREYAVKLNKKQG